MPSKLASVQANINPPQSSTGMTGAARLLSRQSNPSQQGKETVTDDERRTDTSGDCAEPSDDLYERVLPFSVAGDEHATRVDDLDGDLVNAAGEDHSDGGGDERDDLGVGDDRRDVGGCGGLDAQISMNELGVEISISRGER